MNTNATVSLAAKDIANARFHCDHLGDNTSYDVPNGSIVAYIDGTPAELFAAAARLNELAAAQMTKEK